MKSSRLDSLRKLGPRHGPVRSPNNSSGSHAHNHEIGTNLSQLRKNRENTKKSTQITVPQRIAVKIAFLTGEPMTFDT